MIDDGVVGAAILVMIAIAVWVWHRKMEVRENTSAAARAAEVGVIILLVIGIAVWVWHQKMEVRENTLAAARASIEQAELVLRTDGADSGRSAVLSAHELVLELEDKQLEAEWQRLFRHMLALRAQELERLIRDGRIAEAERGLRRFGDDVRRTEDAESANHLKRQNQLLLKIRGLQISLPAWLSYPMRPLQLA